MSTPSTIVLITGANSGVGHATAQILATASPKYHIILAARTPEKGTTAATTIRSLPNTQGQVSSIVLDVTSESDIAAAVQRIENDFGHLDVLINNAGISSKAPKLKDQLEELFQTNVVGPAIVTEAFEPLLLKSANPYLLHISSGLGSLTMSSDPKHEFYNVPYSGYRMSKSALNMLTVQDAKTLGGKGVKVFAVCPGLVESNLRGVQEEERTMGGAATSPLVSGETVLGILEGGRDAERGLFLHKDGVYPW